MVLGVRRDLQREVHRTTFLDLRRDFPEMKGFSPRNLLFMRAFAEAYPDQEIVKQLVS